METNTVNAIEQSKAQTWLANILEEKTKKNPLFSMRAFARMVDVSPAVLSRILSGKRKLTFNLAVRIADALALGPQERELLYSFYLSRSTDGLSDEGKKEKELSIDCFNAMKEWYHYGITQLFYIEGFREDHKWMAKMLSISELEVKLAIERLIRLEILDRNEDGKLFRTATHFSTTTDIASAGIRHFQKQLLEKAITSLESDDIHERDITSITVAINEDKMKEAKAEIKKFRLHMSEFMGEGEKTRVYNLGIHLIPLSKSSKKLSRRDQSEI
ncbi:MAG: TIGR02147 family protein [Bacteriovorax sp.]